MTNTKKTESKKATAQSAKKILYEAVQEHPVRNYIIVGALTRAGLYNKYQAEKAVYGVENIKPSITDEELDKIIKNYIGD